MRLLIKLQINARARIHLNYFPDIRNYTLWRSEDIQPSQVLTLVKVIDRF